jgi:ABC-2 type transport system ATP-binding protein
MTTNSGTGLIEAKVKKTAKSNNGGMKIQPRFTRYMDFERRQTMYAIEVNDLHKVFIKWETSKKDSTGENKNVPGEVLAADTAPAIDADKVDSSTAADKTPANENGHDANGSWLSRVIPHRTEAVALDKVNFKVSTGEIFGLLGPNGSGKSTLIRILSTLLLPDAGSVRIFGKDCVTERYQVQRVINRVSVDAAFFKKLSAHENLMFAARLYGVPAAEVAKRSKEILEKIAFDVKRYGDPLEDFSRGMQQKVAIARALLTSPIVLLLDEPTTGLDPKSKREVQAFIRDVRELHDTTIILTTHDMDEADRLCDRIGVIEKGKIIALDTSDGLKSRMLKDLNGVEGGSDKSIDDVTLEDVFLHLTGGALKKEDDVE